MGRQAALMLIVVILGTVPGRGLAADPSSEGHSAASREAILRDWTLQDYMRAELPPDHQREKQAWRDTYLRSPESRRDDPVLARLECFQSGNQSLVEQRMLELVVKELEEQAGPIREEISTLVRDGAPGRDPRWRQVYLRACELRRARRLQPLLSRWTQFVFNQHQYVGHSYKYTEVLSDAHTDRQRFFKPGAMLGVLRMDGSYGRVRPLLEDPHGILRNPDVSYDGQRLLFAWKKSDREDDFHLYEMEIDSGRIRQLTEGLGFADYEGVYLPDGNILFSSTRCCQTVDCNWVDVSNLYLMDGDGRFMRRIGFDQVHTVCPSVTDDGRVLYTRWEYNDRGQIFPQPLFQMNPDGTNQQEFYGGNSWFPTNIIHAAKIPGSRKVLAVVTGHHRPAQGKLAVIDPALGRQEGAGIQLIAPVREADYVQVDRYALDGNQFQYPYPVDEDRFLVTLALPTPKGTIDRFNIYFMDRQGRRELVVEGQDAGDGIGCRQIIPLAPRPRPHLRPSTVDYSKNTGTFFLQDIYQGPGLKGIPRGAVKQLRVVALEYRAAAVGSLWQEGLGGRSEVTTPVAVGNGAWDVKVVLGNAKVYEDGSALFRAPARTPIYFQALDERGFAVQTMRSWATLMPGETQSCVGCHEDKNSTPEAPLPVSQAIEAGAQDLAPFYGAPRGFSFAKEIQPILDRHCVRCHTGEPDKPIDLTARPMFVVKTKRLFSQAYLTLTHTWEDCGDWQHDLVNWIDCMSEPTMLPPYARGAAASRLMTLLREGHEGAQLTREEMEKIACWIDLLVPFCGDYLEASAWSDQDRDLYSRAMAKRQRMLAIEEANIRAMISARGEEAEISRRSQRAISHVPTRPMKAAEDEGSGTAWPQTQIGSQPERPVAEAP